MRDIRRFYSWAGEYTPMNHQKETAAFLTRYRRALVLSQIGVGKTLSALWASDWLIEEGVLNRILIVAPLSTLERVWADAIFRHFLHRSCAVLHGSANRRKELLEQEKDYYIINPEGFKIIMRQAAERKDVGLVILDEAAVYRNISTERFKGMCRFLDYRSSIGLWAMTGTPTPQAPTDAWALGRMMRNKNTPSSWMKFRNMVMKKVGPFKWIPKEGAQEHVTKVLTPAIRYTREDCLDLPETTYQTRHIEMTGEQKKRYKEMLKGWVIELGEERNISAVNQAVKVGKLIQIVCGVAYDNDGEEVYFDCTPRMTALKEVIEEAGGKVIVYVPLKGVMNRITKYLSKDKSVGVVNGDTKADDRARIFGAFQNDKEPEVLVAHPGTMAHGLTLTAATTIVWYAPIYSNEQYTQANGRIERLGKKSGTVIHLESTDIERNIYTRLSERQSMQGLLLDVIEANTGG